MRWLGPVAEFLIDETEQIDLEGAIRSGKTTVALWKVHESCTKYAGIHWLICRFSDGETSKLLRPVWEQVCLEAGTPLVWHAAGRYYELLNGSRVYAFGLKAPSLVERYAKFRGLTLAGIYNDQTEELPEDIYVELTGRLSQGGYPHQILLSPNPMEENSWLAREFPEEQTIRHRRYYRVSLYDNQHNLDADVVERLERAYPPSHVKHRPMILGQRGMNVIGQPVYGALTPHQPESAAFQRHLHEHSIALDPTLPLYESLDFGKHHPCVVWAQITPYHDLRVLGGLLGQQVYLEDFLPIVEVYRQRWFPDALEVASCCDPAGSHDNSQGIQQNAVDLLKTRGFAVRYQPDSNSPAIRYAMIERLAGYMRRRTPAGEGFAVDNARWYRVTGDGRPPVRHTFVADALEAGYVWDEHMVSVGSKQLRKPKKDGWYEHGMNCLEYLEHNFGGAQATWEQAVRHASTVRDRETRRSQRDHDPYDAVRRGRVAAGRGGYL